MSDTSKLVKVSYLKYSLANLCNLNENCIKEIQWSESKGSAANDGFTTELVAVKGKANISGKIEDFSFMVKLTPETAGRRLDMVMEMGLFYKECLFYGVIMPLLEKERKQKGLGNLAIPKCFYTHPDPGVLVMKNLKDDSFDLRKNQPENMSKNLQKDAITLFMKSLASFHASTHHLVKKSGGRNSFLKEYPDLKHIPKMPNETAVMFKKSLEETIEEGLEMTKGQINENARINLEKYKSIAWETVDNSYYESIGDYQTLNHGDAWENNAMFRCENGRAREIALIDFQYTRMTSPAVDVIYAIYTGSEPEMRAEHLTKWLKTYHDQFSYELNVFGYDANSVYPFEKFQQDVRDLFPVGLTWAFIVSEVLKNKNSDMKTIEWQMDQEQHGFNSAYRQRLTGLINEAIKNNYV